MAGWRLRALDCLNVTETDVSLYGDLLGISGEDPVKKKRKMRLVLSKTLVQDSSELSNFYMIACFKYVKQNMTMLLSPVA